MGLHLLYTQNTSSTSSDTHAFSTQIITWTDLPAQNTNLSLYTIIVSFNFDKTSHNNYNKLTHPTHSRKNQN